MDVNSSVVWHRRGKERANGWYKAAAPELAALLPRQIHTLYCIAEEKRGGGVGVV